MVIAAGTHLGSYQIRSAIGAGGQGEVYQAFDTTLHRLVVLKVLPPEHTFKPAMLARFEREARLASSLDHPNICTIHGLHETNGVRFIAMQYVEGKNVRQLVKGHPLELTSALTIAIQVADALAAAHARGIVHRDIKAGNVMVTETGVVKVLDFGLAKLLEPEREDTNDPHLTELGVPYGTATYAAPEQAAGGKVDHRADIFSTGVLLYEMLAGTWPFKGQNNIEVRYAVLHDEPAPLARARGEESSVIERLQEVLDRALAKDPAGRYQRVEDLSADLRAILREIDPEASQGSSFPGVVVPVAPRRRTRAGVFAFLLRRKVVAFMAGGALLLALAVGVSLYLNRARHVPIDSLAVLPFTNVGADPDAEYLSDGISESLINSLSQLPSIKVRSRNSVFRYKGRGTAPEKIGSDLGVRAVLTGQVRRRGDEIAVNVELIDVQDDSHIWGESYTRRLSDLPRLQEELSRDITDKLRLRLSGADEQRLVKSYATNSEAYQLYLQGRYYWNKRTGEGLQKGIEYFTRAIEKDGNYAPAYSGLADCYSLLNVYDVAPATESEPKAREAATRALALDDGLAEAHASLASVSYRFDWNWPDAEQHFKRAIELKPDYATAHQWYSAMLAAEGRFDEANAEARRAHELEPFSLTINSVVGRRLYYAHQYEQALVVHRRTVEMDRTFVRGHVELGSTLAQMGRTDEAVAEFRQALALDEGSITALAGLGHAYAASGQRGQALQLIGQLNELAKRRYVSPYHLAIIYAGLGERERALDELERAADERYNWLVFLKVEPLFESLHSEPRFNALVRRVGLPL
ncbi:MAG: eukaryotic-like serine/threonine-protein kinase [Acidobacteriota bacterium]|jgi:serine/threonine-protein kinase|nr:eukaryotic-like serine/threonine-protein kinase [Acidobacteriota bacterium]